MRITYADTLPLPMSVGGPNEGIGDFADGLDADPSLETHKNDLNLMNHPVSRLETLRRLARTRTARAIAIAALVLPLAACNQGGEDPQAPGTVAEASARPNGETGDDPSCTVQFERLDAAGQQECRMLIASMETDDINQLSGLEQARWASYYRHVALGEKSVLHTVVRANILEQPSGAESVALRFITDYQNSVFTLAWLMQNKPSLANDPRTIRALLGSDDTASEGFKAAKAVAGNIDTNGAALEEYVQSASQSTKLFSSVFPQNPEVKKEGSDYVVRFTAHTITDSGSVKPQQFTYRMFPYMDAVTGGDGRPKEQPDDPKDPTSVISTALGQPLLASTPQIRDAAA